MEVVALLLTAEFMLIDSQNYLFKLLKGTEFESKIERSNYNKRCNKLNLYIEEIRKTIVRKFGKNTKFLIIDSTPASICKVVRAGRSNICSTYEISPEFGYCASQKKVLFWLQNTLHL